MKTNTRRALLVAMLFTVIVALAVSVVAQDVTPTNAITSTNTPAFTLPPGIEQLTSLFGEQAKTFLTKAIIWLGSISVVLSPFAVSIRHRLFNVMNAAAESSEQDDDVWLGKVLSNPAYKFVAMLLRLVRFDLPTEADLDRAIAMQKEAAGKNVSTTGG